MEMADFRISLLFLIFPKQISVFSHSLIDTALSLGIFQIRDSGFTRIRKQHENRVITDSSFIPPVYIRQNSIEKISER